MFSTVTFIWRILPWSCITDMWLRWSKGEPAGVLLHVNTVSQLYRFTPWYATDAQPDHLPREWGALVLLVERDGFILPVCEQAASTYPKRSPSLLHKTLPAIPVFMRRLCGGLSWRQASLLPAYLGLALCLLWLVLSSPWACTTTLKRHFDGVLLPILPSLNRSCCHLYFDLCIPWSAYACERRERRGGGQRGGGVGGGRQRQLQCSLLYPGERLRYICLLKASAPDKHGAAAERYKAPSVVPKAPRIPSHSPSWVSRHCMHVLYAQTKKVFFQLRPVSLKRVKRCCSPLWELQKPKARKKTHRVLLQLLNPPQTRAIRPEPGFRTQYARLSSAFARLDRGKPLEGSRRTGTEEQTNLFRKEGELQRLHSHKERISQWDADPVASPLFISAIKQIS